MTTDLKVIRFSSMRGNACDNKSGTIYCCSSTVIVFTCYQGKVQEGQFDDFPTRYCDIPGTNPVCVIVVGKIGAGNLTTSSIDDISRRATGWEKKYLSVTLLVSCSRQNSSSKIEIENVFQTSTFITISLPSNPPLGVLDNPLTVCRYLLSQTYTPEPNTWQRNSKECCVPTSLHMRAKAMTFSKNNGKCRQ